MVLTSTQNQRVKRVIGLRERAERERSGRYLVEGLRALTEVDAAGTVEEIFATPDAQEHIPPEWATRVTLVEPHVLRRMTDSVTPQGVVAVARREPARLEDVLSGALVVVLDRVADPGNVGAILRTAAAAGAAGVVLTPDSVDPWNPKSVRASAGAIARVPVVVDIALADAMTAASAAAHRVVATSARGGAAYTEPGVLDPPLTLVFGSEAHGLSPQVVDAVDGVVSIPHYGPVESLNLAAAVAVVLFEAARTAARPGRERHDQRLGQRLGKTPVAHAEDRS